MQTKRLLALLLIHACLSCLNAPIVEEKLRDDLSVLQFHARIIDGLSDQIQIPVPAGATSMLIEVRGDHGLYYLTELVAPSGRDVIEGAKFQTRGAREVAGLVDWLYPNTPTLVLMEGEYGLTIRGRDARNGRVLTEDIDVSVYLRREAPMETCGLHLDFLIDDAALDPATMQAAVDSVVEQVDRAYRQIGIKVIDYQTYRVNMQSSQIDLGNGSATRVVDDVLSATIPSGAARNDALHILLVRRIGGSLNPNFDPAGYSMGLPGPHAANRDTSAVLVSTELYADRSGKLDVDGLSSSLTHEIGHYLGLYHTSERNGANHDPLPDTARCNSEYTCSEDFRRNIMTSSFWLQTGRAAERNRFTEGQGVVMRGHPLCVPTEVSVLRPVVEECTLGCEQSKTCAVIDQRMGCKAACDPNAANCSPGRRCEPDELGTYVCLDGGSPGFFGGL